MSNLIPRKRLTFGKRTIARDLKAKLRNNIKSFRKQGDLAGLRDADHQLRRLNM